jgi:hypothetical protein
MRKKKTSGSVSTKLRKLPEVSPSPNSLLQASLSWKLFRRITDLPLDRFITAYCDGDLTALIIEGHPPAEKLAEAWDELYDEYTMRMASDDYREIQEVSKEINIAIFHFNAVKSIAQLLRFFPVQEIVDVVQPALDHCLGFPWPLDLSNKETFLQQLEGAEGHAARFFTEAEALKLALPKPKRSESGGKPTRESFDELIVVLSRYNKYKVSKHDTTVSEFIAMLQDMHRGLEAMRRAQNN